MIGQRLPTRVTYDELPADLQGLLAARYRRLGYLGEFFQCAAHQPEALAHFVNFTETLKDALPSRLVEIIALTIASSTGNRYEQVQHERLALVSGFSVDEVESLVAGQPERCSSLSAAELAAAALARSFVDPQGVSSATCVRDLHALVDEEIAVGCVLTAGRYIAHSAMANAWELLPPVASPIDSESAA